MEKCYHNWEARPAGFSYEGGHTDYSVCTRCGIETEVYPHGDFSAKSEAEIAAEEKDDAKRYAIDKDEYIDEDDIANCIPS